MKKVLSTFVAIIIFSCYCYSQDFLGFTKADILKVARNKENFAQKQYSDGRTAIMWYEPKMGVGIIVNIKNDNSYQTIWSPLINETEVINNVKTWLSEEYTKISDNQWSTVSGGVNVYVDFGKFYNNKKCFVFHH